MQLNFITVDVFTDQQFGGNPLAVVLNGHPLANNATAPALTQRGARKHCGVVPCGSIRIASQRGANCFRGALNA